ncbi:MAG: ankyrin repeat domain-containing protein [Rhodospirillaceae bacterium]|nr:ankyrin repeat domain-containing protein [Rhodospirillaceae bacterium]
MKPGKHHRTRIRDAIVVAGFAASLTACTSSTEEAQRELASIGVEFNEPAFRQVLDAGDNVTVELFLRAGMAELMDSDELSELLMGVLERGDGDAEIVVRLLLDAGANPNYGRGFGIFRPAEYGQEGIVRALLEAGADPHHGAVYFAARNGHEGILRMLLDAGAHKGAGIDDAARYGYESIVRELLDAGARPTRAMISAAGNGDETMVRMLLDAGADPNEGIQPAAQNDHEDVVLMLFDAGAEPAMVISEAARYGHQGIVRCSTQESAQTMTEECTDTMTLCPAQSLMVTQPWLASC